MKKTSLLSILLVSSSVLLGSMNVIAAEEGVITKNSDLTVEFIPLDGPTKPTDPDNPDPDESIDPLDPENPDPENPIDPDGTTGPLTLDFASNLYFGINYVSSKTQTYHAFAQPIKDDSQEDGIGYVANYVQLTDNRGTLEGWNLTVKQNSPFTAEGNYTLDGASISFENATANHVDKERKISLTEEKFELGIPEDANESDSALVMSANEDQGDGTWVYRFGENSDMDSEDTLVRNEEGEIVEGTAVKNPYITLTVPGTTATRALRYETTVTWTLGDTPDNSIK